jgi:hypothetical protein
LEDRVNHHIGQYIEKLMDNAIVHDFTESSAVFPVQDRAVQFRAELGAVDAWGKSVVKVWGSIKCSSAGLTRAGS